MSDIVPNPEVDTLSQTGALPDVIISRTVEMLRENAPEALVEAQVLPLHPADIAELFAKIDDDDRRRLLQILADKLDANVLPFLEPLLAKRVLAELEDKVAARLIAELESDDTLELIEALDENHRTGILKHLSSRIRAFVEEGLSFPEDSAGRMMQREFVAVPEFWTVGKTLDYLRAAGKTLPESFLDIFIVDPLHKVTGELRLSDILRAERKTRLRDIAQKELHVIPVNMDQEEVAFIFRRDTLASAPVVDEAARLIGVITIDDVMEVIDEEAQEDLLKLAGVSGEGDIYRAAFSTALSRFSWLTVNLFTAVLASIVIGLFSTTIEQIVALAVLMPIVASMGGNAGTQTLTVAVRALATKQLSGANAVNIISKELLVGILNGIAFAALIGVIAGLWFQSSILGAVIAAAMVVNMIVAGLSGILIPLSLQKWGIDPALASGVFLTTVTDIVGFFVFLGLAALVLM